MSNEPVNGAYNRTVATTTKIKTASRLKKIKSFLA